jgi:hypothetical protein
MNFTATGKRVSGLPGVFDLAPFEAKIIETPAAP